MILHLDQVFSLSDYDDIACLPSWIQSKYSPPDHLGITTTGVNISTPRSEAVGAYATYVKSYNVSFNFWAILAGCALVLIQSADRTLRVQPMGWLLQGVPLIRHSLFLLRAMQCFSLIRAQAQGKNKQYPAAWRSYIVSHMYQYNH